MQPIVMMFGAVRDLGHAKYFIDRYEGFVLRKVTVGGIPWEAAMALRLYYAECCTTAHTRDYQASVGVIIPNLSGDVRDESITSKSGRARPRKATCSSSRLRLHRPHRSHAVAARFGWPVHCILRFLASHYFVV